MPLVQYIGNYGFIGVGKESTFGTPVAATKYWPFESEGFETDPAYKPIPTIRQTRAENNLSYGDEIKSVGNLVYPFGPVNGMPLLAWALGTDSVTGSGPYVHVITPNEAGIPSFTVEKNLAGLTSQQFAGCIVNKADLELVSNAPAKLTIDTLNQIDVTPFTPTTPSFAADQPFALKNYAVSIFGSPNVNVASCKLSIDNMAKGVFTFSGQRYSTLNFSSGRVITGELTLILQSMGTQYTDAMAGTYGALTITLSESASLSTVFSMLNIQWGKPSQALKRGELIMQTLPFTAYDVPGSSYDLQLTVTNSVSAAY